MSIPCVNIKNYKIILNFADYGMISAFLTEELQTKKQKIVFDFKNIYQSVQASGLPIKQINLFFDILLKFNHPMFITTCGYCLNNFKGEPSLMLFYHDSPYGNLATILEKESLGQHIPNFTSTKKYIILLGISLALKFSHSRGTPNCSLSTENIILDENFYPRMNVLNAFSHNMKDFKLEADSIFEAPEILNGQSNTYASDVYSFSVIAYELITGQTPLISKGKWPDLMNIKIESIRTFISKCSSENPEERPSFCEIYEALQKNEFKKYFNVNEDEVMKYLNQFEDELTNPNLYKPFNLNSSINEVSPDETFTKALQLSQNEENKIDMIKMLQKSSEFGNIDSMFEYSILLETGNGISIDRDKSLHLLKMAADKGNLKAMNKYGVKCMSGDGAKIDLQASIHYFKSAAEKGSVESMINLGNIYMQKDLDQSLYYFKMASDCGSAEGMHYYGKLLVCHFHEVKKGIQYIKKAAEKGIILAMYDYAVIVLNNSEFEEKKKEAARYLRKASKYGNVEAIRNYGIMLFRGDGIQMNRKKGIKYIQKAADYGNTSAMEFYVMSFSDLKINDDENIHDLFSIEDVIRYMKMLVETGKPYSYFIYGSFLLDGIAFPVDKKEGSYYIKLAADKGCVEAMLSYGIMCRDGDCVKTNKIDAAFYLKMAADNGNDIAMKDYAMMLYEGDGIKQNLVEAKKYMKMSTDAGNLDSLMIINTQFKDLFK